MQERFDTEEMIERARTLARQVRASEAYPAIIGGIAGGIAGALIAAMIASRSARSSEPAEESRAPRASRPGFDARSLVELVTVLAGLLKQVREWYSQERKR